MMDSGRPKPSPVVWSTDRRITRRGVLWLGLACDMRCKFCYDDLIAGSEKAWIPVAEATAALDKSRYFYGAQALRPTAGISRQPPSSSVATATVTSPPVQAA